HNPIEPAQYGCTVFWGPVGYNFLTVLEDFRSAQALVEVADEEALAQAVSGALTNPADYKIVGDNAARMTAEKSGVLDGIMQDIKPVLDSAMQAVEAERKAS
ncbi:MAG TPA: hypothetical protein PLW48_07540, partial [Alphaproteobacteria bacterium]|nr:hypothetical protein [Alphaproteobacteria bacterium]